MKRFNTKVLVRANSENNDSPEELMKVNVTALNELYARRQVLEQAWANGLVVKEFLSVQVKGA